MENIKINKNNLHQYQISAIDFIYQQQKCALFLDMGLGKTVISLTAASKFLDDFLIRKVLVISPLRVANTVWKQEAKNWDHLKHFKINICTGSVKERRHNLDKYADIYVINRENIPWLVETYKWDWDMVIVDESSSFKNVRSNRFKALKKVIKYIKSIVLLSGTPSPNGLMNLWSQIYLIDSGERLGKTITNYRQKYFRPSGYMGYTWKENDDSDDKIKELIKDIAISMESKDYLELPDKITLSEYIIFPDKVQTQYKELEKEFLLSLEQDTDIEALSSGVLANKLLQLCTVLFMILKEKPMRYMI